MGKSYLYSNCQSCYVIYLEPNVDGLDLKEVLANYPMQHTCTEVKRLKNWLITTG